MYFLWLILVSTACAARRSRPKFGNSPICVPDERKTVRAAVATAVVLPKQVEPLLADTAAMSGDASFPSMEDFRPIA
jgi:hypothetical protein